MQIDPKALRAALSQFMTGVTVVTARSPGGDLIGFTANSFTSVSLDPPLLLVCPGRHLSSFDAFARAEHFAVSVLAEGQEHVSNLFAKSGTDRFAQADYDLDPNGAALISGRAAGFSCQTFQRVPAGDHMLLIGQITGFDKQPLPPLGYCPDGYFSLSKERQADAASASRKETIASVILRQGQNLLLDANGHLPSTQVGETAGARSALRGFLDGLGIEAHLGPVYSIYDETAGLRRKVLLGRVSEKAPTAPLQPHPISKTASLRQPTDALNVMLARFSAEHQSQSFGLYIGDAQQGEIHLLDKD